MSADIKNFRLPRYNEVPDLGLYLDQTVKYLNYMLGPLGCIEVTSSMVSNYVKKKYIDKPNRKLYSREQIISLLFIVIAKLVLPMDNIAVFMEVEGLKPMQKDVYDDFCSKFEDMLMQVFYNEPLSWEADPKVSEANTFALSLLVAVSHYIYLCDYLDLLRSAGN